MLASINMVEKPHMLQSIWDASDTTSGEGASGALGVAPRHEGFPGSSDGEESACNAGDPGLNPGSGTSPGEGNGYLLQYSCLENSMDRGTLELAAPVHEVEKSRTHCGAQLERD